MKFKFKIILWPLIVLSINAIALLLLNFSIEVMIGTIAIVLVSQILMLFGLFYFVGDMCGSGGIKDWLKFVQELKSLKDSNVHNCLAELTKLPKTLEILNKTLLPESILLPSNDYLDLINDEKIDEVWVLGASLNLTLDNLENFMNRLKKGRLYQFLCRGSKDDIKYRAEQIVKYLKENSPESSKNLIANIKMRWIEDHFFQFPMEILNPHNNNSKVVIRYPYEAVQDKGKDHVFLVMNKLAIRKCIEKYRKLWDSHKETELELLKLSDNA